MAEAIRRAARLTDTTRLGRILAYSYSIRDPDVFEAALQMANDRTASAAARALGLILAVAQHNPRLSFQGSGRSTGSLFVDPLSSDCSELVFLTDLGDRWFDAGPPANAVGRLRASAEALGASGEPSLVLRRLSRCAALLLPDAPTDAIPVGAVTVDCTCEEFMITNNTDVRLELEYVLEATPPEHGTIVVLPRERELVLHDGTGGLRLLQGGRLVAYKQFNVAGCDQRR